MSSSLAPFQWLIPLLLILITSTCVTATKLNVPRLGVFQEKMLQGRESEKLATLSEDLKTYYYNQTLDHFNYKPESYTTFKQRYVIDSKHWGGAKATAPIFAYLGEESPLDYDVGGIGFLTDNAHRFKALLVYIEHRYYGQSIPFGSREEAMKNASTSGYFSSAQAIADYAEILMHVKKELMADNSPVIVVGGSYGGMLASWFRLKYPHIALGALASSAPILYFDGIAPQKGYYSIVEKDFREASEECYKTIRKSWSEIDKVASKPNGLSVLSKRFKTCTPLNKSSELKDYLDTIYAASAQYNRPPSYPVTIVCGGIDGAPVGTDILGRVIAGLVAIQGNSSCYDTNEYNYPSETSTGWSWQTCTEMVMPIGHDKVTMFPTDPFNMTSFINHCYSLYGVTPRPHWVTTYYGGNDIKLILRKFASNIIFSNGLRDPYSSGGVLEDISHSVVALHTANGSHCLDILPAMPSDPQWLIMQRDIEVKIIEGWIDMYYKDLHAFNK